MYYVIVIVIILIIIYFGYHNNKIIEGYDARFTNMDLVTCANFSKINSGSVGFAYDKVNGVCYPSQYIVGDYPTNSIFKNEYNDKNLSCNKFEPILNADAKPLFNERRLNAIFICKEGDDHAKYYYHNNNKLTDIGEGKMIDHIINTNEYSVNPYSWPIDNLDKNQTDLLLKLLSQQNILPSNTTNAEEIKTFIPPTLIHYTTPLSQSGKGITYTMKDDFNNGSLLYSCVKNIDKDACLTSCSGNNNCSGVEFNPMYKGDVNVCCQYHTIGNYIKRDNDTINGKFYEKIII